MTAPSGPVAIYSNVWGSGNKLAAIPKHPLEASDYAAGPRLTRTLDDARAAAPHAAAIIAIDTFLLDRSPTTVTTHLEKLDGLLT
ncbi:hypothetical protein OG417_00235 [Actinoallomurus sp. NBC_01490]|uniref:hypothetical protein n=1 Tax=Actinoallomurus sp. NBC_01490 TaxID=2903557 RepID=UPI002E320B06|nr:hypothetical protein [Actinoallomurus sp. NBC_01490]